MSPLKKKYFNHVVAFLVLEHGLSKTGDQGVMSPMVMLHYGWSLTNKKWIDSAILKGLKILENDSMTQDPASYSKEPYLLLH